MNDHIDRMPSGFECNTCGQRTKTFVTATINGLVIRLWTCLRCDKR